MPRRPKVALNEILIIPEIHSRDAAISRSKAEAKALKHFREEVQGAILVTAKQDVSSTAQGEALGTAIPPLVVSEIPQDLPSQYRKDAKGKRYALVDGFSRYVAIGEAINLDVRVPVAVCEGKLSMTDLMTLSLDLNERHAIPLTKTQKRAQLFRLMIHGELFDASLNEIATKYGGIINRSTVSNYRSLAEWTREVLSLDEASFEEILPRLKDFTETTSSGLFTPEYDEKGYPVKATMTTLREIIENGQDAFEERVAREHDVKQIEGRLAVNEVMDVLGNLDPEDALKVMAEARARTQKRAEETVSATFVDEPQGFDGE